MKYHQRKSNWKKQMPRVRKQSAETKKRRTAARRKQETPEQRALRLEKCRAKNAFKRANETQEERAARLARDRARIYTARCSLKMKAKAANVKYFLNQVSSNSPDKSNLTEMSKKDQAAYKAHLLLETQRAAAAKSAADRRNRETLEQRTARLEKCRIRSAISRASEDEETRAVRLARQRIRTNSARFKQRLKEVESQEVNQQKTGSGINNIVHNHGKSLVKSFKQHPYSNHSVVAIKDFRNKLLIQQFHQLQLAYNFNAHLSLQAALNQSQLAFSPSNIWPRLDHLDLVLESRNTKVHPFITPDEKVGEVRDEESDLDYDTSKCDIVVECDVTIEEDNKSAITQPLNKRELIEEENPPLDYEPTKGNDEIVDYSILPKSESEEEGVVFETIICGLQPTVKQEPIDTKENLNGDP